MKKMIQQFLSIFTKKKIPQYTKIPCPVCSALSFDSSYFPGSYFICDECGWEDDDVQYDDPDFEGGANDVSLNQPRENYKLHKFSDPTKMDCKPNLPG